MMYCRAAVRLASICAAAAFFTPATAQTAPTISKYSPVAHDTRTGKEPTARRESELGSEGRQHVISIITSLADEATAFKDQTLRVRVQAQAADALWETDRKLSETLFLRAWETAEKIDKEGERATEEALKKPPTSRRGTTVIPIAPNLRAEVLQLAARRDQELGEKFLEQLKELGDTAAAETDQATASQVSFLDPTEPPTSVAKRLELATELLKAGAVERAKMFADKGLNFATSQGIIFLCMLRQKDAAAADERYASLLALTAEDPSADATTVSLLSSYVFTPHLIVTATRRGRVSNQWSETALPAVPSVELRQAFLRVAAQILLRALPPPERDRTSAGTSGTYFTIARLLPLFLRYAPEHHPALSARLSVLRPDTLESYQNNDAGLLTAGLTPENSSRDDLSAILSQLPGATGSAGDLIYLKAVRAAALKGDERVRELADQIENPDLKKQARSFADFVVVRMALDRKDVEVALSVLRGSELPLIQRVWAYTESARLLGRSDLSRASQLLDKAAEEARKINNGEPERVYALTCIATQLFESDRPRSWEMAAELVKASNAVADFPSDQGRLTARLQAKNVTAFVNVDVPSFNIASLFELLARDNYQLASETARGFKGDATRATANLAIARSLLRELRVD